jgi:hypothetical protein
MNIYYSPEKFGLTQVGMIDWSDGNYQFDYTVVWQDNAGNFFYGDDAGCSCPLPFENSGVNYLTALTSLAQFNAHCFEKIGREDRTSEMVDLVEKLHAAGLR